MRLERISSPIQNKLVAEYWSAHSDVHSFFPYRVQQQSFHERVQYLQSKSYNRLQLVEAIEAFMKSFAFSNEVKANLSLLRQDAYVVVAGQQAGLLTGPLFSVYKAITAILLAKEQSEKLQHPVVPLFWIAGEDHDIHEINHTYTIRDEQPQKMAFINNQKKKTIASETIYEQEQLAAYVQNIFKDYGETAFTAQLLQEVLQHVKRYKTYTQFFAALFADLFAKHGLLMIDAAFEPFRRLQGEHFELMIDRHEEIRAAVLQQENALYQLGYPKPLEMTEDNANLFYVKDGERFLLQVKDQHFVNPLAHVKFTSEQLKLTARETPEFLSNNVVTRPLMQEFMLPVLAFVGGPGELAYWATLKTAFEAVQLQMPIFIPRISATVVTRRTASYLRVTELTIEQVLNGQTENKQQQFIESVEDRQAQQLVEQMERMLEEQYETLRHQLQQGGLSLDTTIERNQQYHKRQFAYLRKKMHEQVIEKHRTMFKQFDLLKAEILPNDRLQERLFSPYFIMNVYGRSFVDDLLALPLEANAEHYIVTL